MSTQLWVPVPRHPQLSAAERFNETQPNTLPGTWLQLSPTASAVVSPALYPEPAPVLLDNEDLSLRPKMERFLSNESSSRNSSISSITAAPAPVYKEPSLGPSLERREMAVGRAGGLAAVFGGN